MKRLVASVAILGGVIALGACTPAQIAAVTAAKRPPRRASTPTTTVTLPADRVLRWQCHVDGTSFPVLVNNQGKADLTPSERATCVAISPVTA